MSTAHRVSNPYSHGMRSTPKKDKIIRGYRKSSLEIWLDKVVPYHTKECELLSEQIQASRAKK